MANSFVIGIDPGINGGLCILELTNRPVIVELRPFTSPLPLPQSLGNTHVFIEQVSSSPLMGTTSAFTFGKNYGTWLGALERTPPASLTKVTPAVWQHAMSCRAKGDKRRLKSMALRLSGSDPRITLSTADAYLLAEYGRRVLYTELV